KAHRFMKTATEYRAMAEECFKWAREAQTKENRVSLKKLAQVWLDAASKLDEQPPGTTKARCCIEGEMKTIRQSKVIRTCKGACRVGDIVIFDVLGAAPRVPRKRPLATLRAAWRQLSKLRMTTLTEMRF